MTRGMSVAMGRVCCVVVSNKRSLTLIWIGVNELPLYVNTIQNALKIHGCYMGVIKVIGWVKLWINVFSLLFDYAGVFLSMIGCGYLIAACSVWRLSSHSLSEQILLSNTGDELYYCSAILKLQNDSDFRLFNVFSLCLQDWVGSVYGGNVYGSLSFQWQRAILRIICWLKISWPTKTI